VSDDHCCGQVSIDLFRNQWKTRTGQDGADDVEEKLSRDFDLAAADGDIYSRPRRLNDHGQKLLAGFGQAERRKNFSAGSHSDLNSALAYDGPLSSLQPATNANDGGSAWRYQGGPKPR
jgi:hypothetical protein